MADVAATTCRFRAREHPDPVEFVGRSVSSPYPILAKVRVLAPYDDLTARVTRTSAHVTRLDADSCLLETGAGNVYALAFHLAWLGFELEVLDPPSCERPWASWAPGWPAPLGGCLAPRRMQPPERRPVAP